MKCGRKRCPRQIGVMAHSCFVRVIAEDGEKDSFYVHKDKKKYKLIQVCPECYVFHSLNKEK